MTKAKPLAGIRVLDFGSFITAPYAAMLMGELGADVIKVERPGAGDPFRAFNGGLYSSHFQAHNRNKRSVALEHSAPQAEQALQALIESADVLLLNVRPGVEDKLGLSYERVRSLNAKIIYCSITGYGSSGPYAERAAYDNVGQALSGWLSMFHQGEDARVAGPAVSDALTGLFATIGVLAALNERFSTGIGRKVEVSMLESMIAFATEPLARLFSTGKPSSFYSRAAASQSFIVTCGDGERIGLHLSSPTKFWDGLVAAVDSPSLQTKYVDRASRVKRYDELSEDLASIFAKEPRDFWLPLLEAHDVPFAPERRLEELEKDPQVVHQGVIYTVDHPIEGTIKAAHRPVRYDGDNRSDFRAPPTLGEHTKEVLMELGIEAATLRQLAEQGIIG